MIRTLAARRHRGGDDRGFTLIEVTVAVAIISVVMLGLGAVFVATAAGTDAQGLRQVAARLATDGLDRTRALGAANLLTGRDAATTATQWAARPAGVRSLLAGLAAVSDPKAATGAGSTAALPTTAESSTSDGVTYARNFYVASCQLTTAGACVRAAAAGTVPMYEVVVGIGWRDKGCRDNACTYQVSTLLAATTSDPLFNSNYKPVGPTITPITATVVQDVTETATAPAVTFTGGNGAVTLAATGVPAGVTLDPVTGRWGGTLSAVTPGTTVTVTATDRFNLISQTTFTWTVNALPTLTDAVRPALLGVLADPIDLPSTLKLTGGTAPYRWDCGTLPAGLVLDAGTGALTGTLATLGLRPLTCSVTDGRQKQASATLTLDVAAPVLVTAPANGSTSTVYRTRGAVSSQAVATGCTVACTWSATGLPAGVTIAAATGLISGRPTTAGTYTITVTARDTAARTGASTFTWRVI